METSVKPNRSKQQQQAKHTPWPWQIVDPNGPSIEKGVLKPNGYRPISIANEKGHRVCFVGEHTKDLSRARLIAAAPQLLALAQDFVAIVDESPRDKLGNRAFIDVRSLEAFGSRARAAIAKAEGR